MFTLQATTRDIKTDASLLRKEGNLPAVFYGSGKESTPITISLKDFIKVWKAAGESTAITLETPSGKIHTLIHDVQFNPVTSSPVHADFLVVDMNKTTTVSVPLEFVGVSAAVKNGFGTLVKVLHEVEVEALPKDLPHQVEVDISKLETLEDQIHVSSIKLGAGVSMITDGEEVVALVTPAREEVEATPAVDLSAIAVEKRGKKEEESAE